MRIKVFGGESKGDQYSFQPKDLLKPKLEPDEFSENLQYNQILIGRSDNCDVVIKTKMLSRIQCTISYNPNLDKWIISDGFNARKSTNGIWLYIKEDMRIYSGLKLKSNQIVFE